MNPKWWRNESSVFFGKAITIGFSLFSVWQARSTDTIQTRIGGDLIFQNCGDIRVPLFSASQTNPIVVLSARSAFEDHQKRGFFRIGLLPQLVLQDVTIEFRVATLPEDCFHLIGASAKLGHLAKALEFRNVTVVAKAGDPWSIKASRGRITPHGTLVLHREVLASDTEATLRWRNAEICVRVDGQLEIIFEEGSNSSSRKAIQTGSTQAKPSVPSQ